MTALLASIDAEDHPGRIIERVMSAAREHLGLDVSFVSEFDQGQRIFRFTGGNVERYDVKVEGTAPLEDTYCKMVVDGVLAPVVAAPKENPLTRDMPLTQDYDLACYVGVPVSFSDGRVFGTLCCLSSDHAGDLDERDVVFMRMAAAIVAEQLEREDLAGAERREVSTRIRRAIDSGAFDIVYQPIVALDDGRLLGVEALSRFHGETGKATEAWFDEAWAVGLGVELEMVALRRALGALGGLPDGAYLAINVSPETLLSKDVDVLLGEVDCSKVVLEITEHAHIFDYAPVRERLDELRGRGLRFAVDDVGTGHAGINHLIEFRPEILKIDLSVVRGVRRDPMRRAIAATFATFAAHVGADIVAEGIESREDHEALEILGLTAGQGFHIAKPAPLGELTWGDRAGAPG